MAAGLFAGSLARRLAQYAAAGTAGDLIVKGAGKYAPRLAPVARRATVRTMAVGIVAGRRIGDYTEEARLLAGDMVAEAHASLGETAPAPTQRAAASAAEPHVH